MRIVKGLGTIVFSLFMGYSLTACPAPRRIYVESSGNMPEVHRPARVPLPNAFEDYDPQVAAVPKVPNKKAIPPEDPLYFEPPVPMPRHMPESGCPSVEDAREVLKEDAYILFYTKYKEAGMSEQGAAEKAKKATRQFVGTQLRDVPCIRGYRVTDGVLTGLINVAGIYSGDIKVTRIPGSNPARYNQSGKYNESRNPEALEKALKDADIIKDHIITMSEISTLKAKVLEEYAR